jgi:hypothetical protein
MQDELESFVNNLDKKYFDKYYKSDDDTEEGEEEKSVGVAVTQERKSEVSANNIRKSTSNISALSEQLAMTSGLIQAELERVIMVSQTGSTGRNSNASGIDVLIDMSEHVEDLLNTAKKLKELRDRL